MLLNKTEQAILEEFINNYYRGFSVLDLAKKFNKSVPQIYRAIRKFSSDGFDGFLVKRDNKYTIALSNLIVQSHKNLVDTEKFYKIKDKLRKRIIQLKDLLIEENKSKILSIVLFGSMADNTFNEKSDIDILVIHNSKGIEISTVHGYDFQFIAKKDDEFASELNQFDDFIVSIMRSHIVLYDPFNYFYLSMHAFQAKSLSGFSIPNNIILQREKQLREISDTLMYSIKKKDKTDAVKKFKEYVSLSARLLLLKNGMMPTSKKNTFELYQKLKKVNIENIYREINEKNIKELAVRYIG